MIPSNLANTPPERGRCNCNRFADLYIIKGDYLRIFPGHCTGASACDRSWCWSDGFRFGRDTKIRPLGRVRRDVRDSPETKGHCFV